jgi:hypothetical protein
MKVFLILLVCVIAAVRAQNAEIEFNEYQVSALNTDKINLNNI